MQLDLTSFCVMNREASARRPRPMGAPPSFRASLRRRGESGAAPPFPAKENSKLFTGGRRARAPSASSVFPSTW